MCESLYCVKTTVQNGLIVRELNWPVHFMEGENACLPATLFGDHKPSDAHEPLKILDDDLRNSNESTLAGSRIYVDSDLSADLCRKVYDAATSVEATCVDNWFRGCSASLVVCEAPSITRYIGHSSNIVTPLWLIKTVKDKRVQRLVRLSVDLARQIGMVLENFKMVILNRLENAVDGGQIPGKLFSKIKYIDTVEERRQKVHLAKMDTRSRRSHETQSHKLPIRPINPSTLLDSICWSISEPTSVASVHIEQFLMNGIGDHSSVFFDAHGVLKDLQDSFDHFTRPLTEREKEDVLFKNLFLTILFPLDRFGELGPSKTFFSSKGFNCIQVLDHIYKFYQENLSAEEIEMAIHTDSRHANCLRSVYASKDSLERGFVTFKRIEFIGRRSFELLKRVSGENNNNVYELLMRA